MRSDTLVQRDDGAILEWDPARGPQRAATLGWFGLRIWPLLSPRGPKRLADGIIDGANKRHDDWRLTINRYTRCQVQGAEQRVGVIVRSADAVVHRVPARARGAPFKQAQLTQQLRKIGDANNAARKQRQAGQIQLRAHQLGLTILAAGLTKTAGNPLGTKATASRNRAGR
jgi:hypothetical protein